jgi:flagellar basal-body rod protein FlgF
MTAGKRASMDTSLYVALSSQMSLEKRINTIADNLANMNTVGFRATQVKFDDVMTQSDGTKVNYVSTGQEYLSADNGAITQTGNPLDFAARGNSWFSVSSPMGNAITKDGRFTMLDTGDLVTLDGYPVLDSGGAPIQLNAQGGMPTVGSDGIMYQNGKPAAKLGLFEADIGPDFVRAGNSAIIPGQTPQPVTDSAENGVLQGYVEEANVNGIKQMTDMIDVSRNFDYVTQLIRDNESSLTDAIKQLAGTR